MNIQYLANTSINLCAFLCFKNMSKIVVLHFTPMRLDTHGVERSQNCIVDWIFFLVSQSLMCNITPPEGLKT